MAVAHFPDASYAEQRTKEARGEAVRYVPIVPESPTQFTDKTLTLYREGYEYCGGDVTLVHLPEIGIRGNANFPMSDLNNLEIADLMSQFLKEKGLD